MNPARVQKTNFSYIGIRFKHISKKKSQIWNVVAEQRCLE
jgi:hypothetical protein